MLPPRIRTVLRELMPPLMWRLGRGLRHGAIGRRASLACTGSFRTWEQARSASKGYDAPHILGRVRTAALQVRDGRAACERDGHCFDEPQYSFPVLSALLRAAAADRGRLRIVDMGGSLGSSYFQNRRFLDRLQEVRWCVVEQSEFVRCGQADFESDELRFYFDLDTCLKEQRPNAALVSGTVQYLPEPHGFLRNLAACGIDTVILDRTPVQRAAIDRLAVQHVPAGIFGQPASFPVWLLNRDGLLGHFADEYELVAEFPAPPEFEAMGMAAVSDCGFILERRSKATESKRAG